MSLTITDEITLEDIDEAIKHINAMIKTDEYGNRMNWRKKELLQNSIDDLLDARIRLSQEGKVFEWQSITNAFSVWGNQVFLYRTKKTRSKNHRFITWLTISKEIAMPRKNAKQIVDEVVAKVNEEFPTAPKKVEPQEPHNRLCMTIVVPGSACNCPLSNS